MITSMSNNNSDEFSQIPGYTYNQNKAYYEKGELPILGVIASPGGKPITADKLRSMINYNKEAMGEGGIASNNQLSEDAKRKGFSSMPKFKDNNNNVDEDKILDVRTNASLLKATPEPVKRDPIYDQLYKKTGDKEVDRKNAEQLKLKKPSWVFYRSKTGKLRRRTLKDGPEKALRRLSGKGRITDIERQDNADKLLIKHDDLICKAMDVISQLNQNIRDLHQKVLQLEERISCIE